MDKLKSWFGTPRRTTNTVSWLLWTSFLISALVGVTFFLVVAGWELLT